MCDMRLRAMPHMTSAPASSSRQTLQAADVSAMASAMARFLLQATSPPAPTLEATWLENLLARSDTAEMLLPLPPRAPLRRGGVYLQLWPPSLRSLAQTCNYWRGRVTTGADV